KIYRELPGLAELLLSTAELPAYLCRIDFVPIDGCACPDGLYQDESGPCIPIEKCPCYNNGVAIQPGMSLNIKNEH
ncbi:hypothetical protein M9458_050148, partial [Cirrhinus mrigala]